MQEVRLHRPPTYFFSWVGPLTLPLGWTEAATASPYYGNAPSGSPAAAPASSWPGQHSLGLPSLEDAAFVCWLLSHGALGGDLGGGGREVMREGWLSQSF